MLKFQFMIYIVTLDIIWTTHKSGGFSNFGKLTTDIIIISYCDRITTHSINNNQYKDTSIFNYTSRWIKWKLANICTTFRS